jgi:hypothetical protein
MADQLSPGPHARRVTTCTVCGDELLDGAHVRRRPWTRGELLAAGWCLGVATFAVAQLVAVWLFS